MTTQAITMNGGAVGTRRSLEELVDRVIKALFGVQEEGLQEPAPTVAKSIHEARRMRQAGGFRRGPGGHVRGGYSRGFSEGCLLGVLRVAGPGAAPVR